MFSLEVRYQELLAKLPKSTSLLAVSKTFSSDSVKELYDLGHRDFGENKVQELLSKSIALEHCCPEIRWHFIGHLQTNKVKTLLQVSNLYAIHSVDREKVWEELLKQGAICSGNSIRIFIEINISGESSKSGLPPKIEVISHFVDKIKNESTGGPFKLEGLMGMGPIQAINFKSETSRCFSQLEDLRNCIDKNLKLSMGMSQDFEIAIQYHSNWVRIGSLLFGGRV